MKELLKKLKVIDHLTTEIEIQKSEFIKALKENVDERNTSILTDIFDIFTSNKKEYKGHVGYEDFELKSRRSDRKMVLAIAKGTYEQKGNILIVKTEINAFRGMMIPFYIFITMIYSFLFAAFIFADSINSEGAVFAIPFIILHAAFMYGIPYFMMRRSTSKMKHELERELFYTTKDKTSYTVV